MAGFSTEGVMPMAPYGGGGMDGMGFGQGGGWIVFLIIAMMFGWGRNGMGAGAGGFTGGETFADQFALQDIKNGIRANGNGICDATYNMAQQNSQTREAVNLGFRDLSAQMSNCCCETNRNIDAVRYENAKNTCDIITSGNMNTRDLIEAGTANTQRIVDMMTANEMQRLREQNNALTLQVSQAAQSTAIINAVRPTPTPAYPVCSPYEVFSGFGGCGCK